MGPLGWLLPKECEPWVGGHIWTEYPFPSTGHYGLLLLPLLPGEEQMPEGAQGHLACLLQALAFLCQKWSRKWA